MQNNGNNNYDNRTAPFGGQDNYPDSVNEQGVNGDEPVFDDEFSSADRNRSKNSRFNSHNSRVPYSQSYGAPRAENYPPQHQRFRSRADNSAHQNNADASAAPEQTRRYSKSPLILGLCLLFLVNLLIIGYVIFNHNYAVIGGDFRHGSIARTDTSELILTGARITDFDGIERLDRLQTLDIRGLDVSVDKYEELRTMIPADCQVLWDVPIGGLVFDSTASFVSFSDAKPGELDSLKYFDNLQSVNASGCTQYAELKQTALDLPECNIEWKIPVGDKLYPSSSTELKLTNDITAEQIDFIKYFPWLVYIDATEYSDYDTLLKLSSDMPNCEIVWKLNLAGVSVSSTTTSLNLSGSNIGNLDEFKRQLSYLPMLKYIDMCNCNLSNDQMAGLRDAFPDKKFVWIVYFGNKNIKTWKVRTDVTVFSTLNGSGGTPFNQNDFAPLFLYCTDLTALDLGHNSITDISLISHLKKLKYLILADNHISDLSPIAELKELEYLEVWLNDISDVTPLQGLDRLYDIDLANNFITDLSQFYSMKNLLSLRLDDSLSTGGTVYNNFSKSDLNKLAAAIPQCRIERLHGDAYRLQKNNNRFLAMKLAFNNQSQVVYFNNWDDVKYSSSFYSR